MRIEPSLAGATERARRYAFGGKPGKAPLQRGRILKSNVGALGFLRRMVLLQHREAVLAGEDQIAVLAESDIGASSKFLLQPPEQRHA